MRERDLAVGILEQIAVGALENARRSAGEARGMVAKAGAASTGLHTDELDGRVFEKRMENANGVTAAADAGDDGIGQAAFGFEDLRARFNADHAMEIADHHR